MRLGVPVLGDRAGVAAYLAKGRAIDKARARRRELIGGVAGVALGFLLALVFS